MGDPLSVAASVTALLTLTKGILGYLSDLRDASKERSRLRDEVIFVSGLLFNLIGQIENGKQQKQSNEGWAGIRSSLMSPRGPLELLKEALELLAWKLGDTTGRLEAAGRIIRWPFQKGEVDAILKKIERQKMLIVIALENDHIKLSEAMRSDLAIIQDEVLQIREGVTKLQLDHETLTREQENQAILNWISPLNFHRKQRDVLDGTQKGTGDWLLGSEAFKNWISGPPTVLWYHGQPGFGKTALGSIIVDYLERSIRMSDVAVVYAYCDYKEQSKQTAENLLSSLLQQLERENQIMSPDIASLYHLHTRRGTRPRLVEWSKILNSEVQSFSKVFVLIDALDECAESTGARDEFLAELRKISPRLHLLLTCRPLPAIWPVFQNESYVQISRRDNEIRLYLNKRLERDSRLIKQVKDDESLKKEIVDKVSDNAQGMFLLARLQMDTIVKQHSRQGVRLALSRFPGRLKEFYDQIIERIMPGPSGEYEMGGFHEDNEDSRLARRILSWTAFTYRPLSVEELQHALAVEGSGYAVDGNQMDEDSLISEDILVSVCGGLVTVEPKSRIVRLVHVTVQEYLDLIRPEKFPEASAVIAKTCIAYISFEEFARGYCVSDSNVETRLQNYPFLKYAARYWGRHLQGLSNPDIQFLAQRFLESRTNLLSTVQVMHLSQYKYPSYSQRFPKDATALQIAAFFNLKEISEIFLQKNGLVEVSASDENGWTALHRASENGNEEFAAWLIERGADVNAFAKHGGTPVHRAAKNAHTNIVEMLIRSGADVDAEDQYGGTALHRAAMHGHDLVARILIEEGADINKKYNSHVIQYLLKQHDEDFYEISATYDSAWTILSEAMQDLQKAEVKIERLRGGTALHEAIKGGHLSLARFLIHKGATVNSTDHFGGTMLHSAARAGYEDIGELLLDKGAHINCHYDGKVISELLSGTGRRGGVTNRRNGGTPLHEAADQGHDAVVLLLLRHGGNPNSVNEHGMTPLFHASINGYAAIVTMLLRHQGDARAIDSTGKNPLHYAAEGGFRPVVTVLLDSGTDANLPVSNSDMSHSRFGRTPLHYASKMGHANVVQLLLQRGAITEPHCRNNETLHQAARQGHELVIQLLLESGADIGAKNATGSTALHEAAWCGHAQVVSLLLDNGIPIDCLPDRGGHTPLMWAVRAQKLAVVELLCKRGASVGLTQGDGEGVTPLEQAASMGLEDILQLLMSKWSVSSRINGADKVKLLSQAAYSGNHNVVDMVLDNGISINERDKYGRSALQMVIMRKNRRAAELLVKLGADPEVEDFQGRTPLSQVASLAGHDEMAKFLLDNGANVNTLDKNGRTPLWWAWGSNRNNLEFYIDHGALPDNKDTNGQTLLLRAAMDDPLAAIEGAAVLLEKGAQPDIQDRDGRMPLSEAIDRVDSTGNHDFVRMLVRYGAKPESDDSAIKVFDWACGSNDVEAVTELIQQGVAVNHEASITSKPLSVALAKHANEVAVLLIQHGADTTAKDADEDTPFIQAVKTRNDYILRSILEKWIEYGNANWESCLETRQSTSETYLEGAMIAITQLENLAEAHRKRLDSKVNLWKLAGIISEEGRWKDILTILVQRGPPFDDSVTQMILQKITAISSEDLVNLSDIMLTLQAK